MNKISVNMAELIRHSNLIEGVHSIKEIDTSLDAWFFLRGQKAITEAIVLRVHQIMMMNQMHDARVLGVYRPHNVYISGTDQVLPHHLHVKELMDKWIVEHNCSTDPRASHIAFEKIHPFADGNGRVGRMLMWHHEVVLDRTPTIIRYENREEYYTWFH
jgi:Fic family protein